MPNLPEVGLYQYNDVQWGVMHSTKVTFRPLPDPSGRMTKAVEHTIELRGYVTPGHDPASTDDDLERLRQRLSEPAMPLYFRDKGYGDLSVNLPGGGRRDVANGPWPKVLSWTPIASRGCAYVEFTLVVTIPECAGARYSGLMAYSCEISYEIDRKGLSTVRYTGEVEIAHTKKPGNRMAATVDAYREQAAPAKLEGFARTWDRWDVSADRRTARFAVTDRQLPVPVPEGAAEIELEHTVKSSALGRGFAVWDATLAGTVTVPAGRPRGTALDVFLRVLAARMDVTRREFAGGGRWQDVLKAQHLVGARRDTRAMLMVTAFQATEDVFGLSSRFGVDYKIFGSDLDRIVNDSGLWRKLPAVTHRAWAGDMEEDAQSPRGNARLRHRFSDDVLIDLCSPARPRAAAGAAPERETRLQLSDLAAPPGVKTRADQEIDEPPPENTWVAWFCTVHRRVRRRVAVHCPIGTDARELAPLQFAVTGAPAPAAGQKGRTRPETRVPPAQRNIVQRVGNPAASVILSGYAVRVGYEIEPPRVLSIGGEEAVPGDDDFEQAVVGKAGLRIYSARWELEYHLAAEPRSLVVPANPALRTAGND